MLVVAVAVALLVVGGGVFCFVSGVGSLRLPSALLCRPLLAGFSVARVLELVLEWRGPLSLLFAGHPRRWRCLRGAGGAAAFLEGR